MVYLKSVENVITLGKLIGLLFLFCLPLLSILFLKTKRNDLARPVMGTIFLVIIIIIHFFRRVFSECTEAVATSLYHIVTNCHGICAFIIGFSSTVWTKKSAKTIRKQVRGCLQNLYQSVAIHLKYVLLVLL